MISFGFSFLSVLAQCFLCLGVFLFFLFVVYTFVFSFRWLCLCIFCICCSPGEVHMWWTKRVGCNICGLVLFMLVCGGEDMERIQSGVGLFWNSDWFCFTAICVFWLFSFYFQKQNPTLGFFFLVNNVEKMNFALWLRHIWWSRSAKLQWSKKNHLDGGSCQCIKCLPSDGHLLIWQSGPPLAGWSEIFRCPRERWSDANK